MRTKTSTASTPRRSTPPRSSASPSSFWAIPNAGIPDLADFLRAQADGELDHYVDADLIIDFFQTGFGRRRRGSPGLPKTLRFIPNDLGDGIRWDNRLNWSTEDLPGTVSGDSVDLGGNWVNYGGTSTINDFDLGDGGTLDVTNGRLNVEGQTDTGDRRRHDQRLQCRPDLDERL